MFFSNCSTTLVSVFVILAIPLAHAEQDGARYTAKRGDCLSGIVKAHYPTTTGHYFVLHSNPDIVDENQIAVGQTILLPGLNNEQILSTVDQTGCNAASLTARNTNRVPVNKTARFVANSRLPSNENPSINKHRREDVPVATTLVSSQPIIEVVPSMISIERQNSTIASNPIRSTPKETTRVTSNRATPVLGTRAVPIDTSQRTMAVRPNGRSTRVSAPRMSKPRFAIDDEPVLQSSPYKQSTPNRYVVNAIGARTLTATKALVQHPDQHFYVESCTDWQGAMSRLTHKSNTTPPTPANNPSSNTATDLDRVLLQPPESKTRSAGNIIVDESLLLKAAAQPGVKP